MNYGFIKVATAIPSVLVGDTKYNTEHLISTIFQAENEGVEIIVFPELSVTGYSCQDLFRQQLLLDMAEENISQLLNTTSKLNIISIIGAPVCVGDLLLNCAIVIQQGYILGIIPKTYLPNYNEFYEKRWFASSQDLHDTTIQYAGQSILVTSTPQLFQTTDGVKFGVEICEDVWAPIPPSNQLAVFGADVIFNLSASNDLLGKHQYLMALLRQQSARTISGYIYSSCGYGESTQDLVYGGNAIIFENGTLLSEADRFSLSSQMMTAQIDVERLRAERRNNSTFINAQRPVMHESAPIKRIIHCREITPQPFTLTRKIDPQPFIPHEENLEAACEEILNIQVMGLAKRLQHTHSQRVVIGISGGLDSTLALLVCIKTFDKLGLDRKGILGVTMPGFGTTDRTYNNAVHLMQELGIEIREINIANAVIQHFKDIGHHIEIHDITYENAQARERTQILMDLSNQVGGLVIGTGDLSELALGWATYNGDHMSMYGVNASVPKTMIKSLVKYVATTLEQTTHDTLLDIINTPISPELTPADESGNIKQKTEDLVGPYELHDFFLYYFLRFGFSPKKIYLLACQAFKPEQYSPDTIKHWLRVFHHRFFTQQFKRSCLPDGPKVGSVSLSPRGDWRMPSDAVNRLWLQECEEL
uniref:Glutamine-dependent NAD(+) synthetase n=1 Tax=Prevotella sp. GTC17260 TaxID=3236796 RepID=A0AB33JCS1_9BACT